VRKSADLPNALILRTALERPTSSGRVIAEGPGSNGNRALRTSGLSGARFQSEPVPTPGLSGARSGRGTHIPTQISRRILAVRTTTILRLINSSRYRPLVGRGALLARGGAGRPGHRRDDVASGGSVIHRGSRPPARGGAGSRYGRSDRRSWLSLAGAARASDANDLKAGHFVIVRVPGHHGYPAASAVAAIQLCLTGMLLPASRSRTRGSAH
jgi:hypothetical protein